MNNESTPSGSIRLSTTCEAERWVAFFGINENGDQPICSTDITIDVEADSIEENEDGELQPCYEVRCPICNCELYGHIWDIVKDNR